MTVDLSGDLAFVDGVASVTLTPRNPSGVDITGVTSVRRSINRKELMMLPEGANPLDHTSFRVAGLSSEPQQGWYVTEADGEKWTVLAVDKLPLSAGHRLLCTKQK